MIVSAKLGHRQLGLAQNNDLSRLVKAVDSNLCHYKPKLSGLFSFTVRTFTLHNQVFLLQPFALQNYPAFALQNYPERPDYGKIQVDLQ